ncbi:MAG TPA: DUF4019 domain-containing protein [Terriglobia bacterium]|jgi:hypothetical protein|nr:DUF4019 domain-containing protein [Terriglobia bacterium]
MNRWMGLALGGVLILGSLGGGAVRAYAQGDPATQPAQQAATEWLALVDQARYGESYDQAAQSFKVAVGREEWTQKATAARAQAGRLVSRRLSRATEMRNPPHLAPGDYVFIVYQSSFANLKSALETVVPVREKDGKWRVVNYMIRPASARPGP